MEILISEHPPVQQTHKKNPTEQSVIYNIRLFLTNWWTTSLASRRVTAKKGRETESVKYSFKKSREKDRDRLDLRPNIRSKQENKSIMDESKVSKHRAGKRMSILEGCKTNREVQIQNDLMRFLLYSATVML